MGDLRYLLTTCKWSDLCIKKLKISFLVDKCSVHPYWMVYTVSFIPLVSIKWANSKTTQLSIHVYIDIFCCVCIEHTPKIVLSISETPCIILSIQQSTRY